MAPKLTVLFVLLGLVEARHCLYDNKGSLSACGRGCAMRPDSNICVSGCLSTRGVSRGCATCLGNGFQCAVRVCRRQCSQGFTTPTCTGCVRASCSRSLCKNAGKSALEEEQYNEEEASTILAAAAFPEPKAVAEEPKPNQTETVASETSERSGRCWEDQVSLKACGTQCYRNPNRGQCARTCLRGHGMSSNCANCFGDKVDCTIRKCLSQCASDSQSYACTSCVRGKCGRCAMEKSLEKSLDSDPSEGSWFDHMMEQIHNLQKEKKENHTATPEAEAVQEANAIFP